MINRYIFTDRHSKAEQFLDVSLGVFLGVCLTVGALAYFDVLFY